MSEKNTKNIKYLSIGNFINHCLGNNKIGNLGAKWLAKTDFLSLNMLYICN